MNKERIFLLSWEFPGYNTRGGTALSKRAGILYKGLTELGYNVVVITRNHNDKDVLVNGSVYCLPGPGIHPKGRNSIIRRIETLFLSFNLGDRSGRWGLKAYRFLSEKFSLNSDDVVISFFTPRGTVLAGYLIARRYNIRWIVDFQDTFDEGLSHYLIQIGKWWFKRKISLAHKCIHVSPEWASRDGVMLNKSFVTLRHCLPKSQDIIPGNNNTDDEISVFYFGSIDVNKQFHSFFFDAIQEIKKCKLYYAGDGSINEFFNSKLGNTNYQFLGWLNPKDLRVQMQQMTFVIIFSYTLSSRMVVPSKLYEVISWNLPCVIVGEDSGGIRSLEKEFGFSFVKARTAHELKEILVNPAKYGNPDYSVFASLSEENFISRYIEIFRHE
ncbi:MAG: glycosyltransferase [Saprospiraceae bacterium]